MDLHRKTINLVPLRIYNSSCDHDLELTLKIIIKLDKSLRVIALSVSMVAKELNICYGYIHCIVSVCWSFQLVSISFDVVLISLLYWLAVVVNKSPTGKLEDEETGRRVKMNKKVGADES